MELVLVVPPVPEVPAALLLALGPGVVVVLRELLDQGVQLVGQLDAEINL